MQAPQSPIEIDFPTLELLFVRSPQNPHEIPSLSLGFTI